MQQYDQLIIVKIFSILKIFKQHNLINFTQFKLVYFYTIKHNTFRLSLVAHNLKTFK